jgi:hypothetical protein
VKATFFTAMGIVVFALLLHKMIGSEIVVEKKKVNLEHLQEGDFIEYNSIYSPILQMGKENEELYIKIRQHGDLETLYGSRLNDITGAISRKTDPKKWEEMAVKYLLHN